MSNCYKCGYRKNIPGDTHSRCKYDWERSELTAPSGSPHGIINGWWFFPINFDPMWMIGNCSAYTIEQKNG